MSESGPTTGALDDEWLRRHTKQYQTDPIAAHDFDAGSNPISGAEGLYPTLLLTTTGRRSGEPRSLPLLYQPCGEGFLVVASKGGARLHPFWYENLLAEPKCEVVAGRFACKARARTLHGSERERYWEWMARFWPDYTRYQARTEREIPVVKLVVEAVGLMPATCS